MMKEKKDIFHGKVKKEYYSYILGYMIFFALLFVVGMALCLYAYVLEQQSKAFEMRFLFAVFGVFGLIVGGGYVPPALFVIRKFPGYPKLRRILFNSDIYFTDSTSKEYFGGSRTLRGRMNKAAFETVTVFAEAEKGMGNQKPIRYKIYLALVTVMSILGLADLIALPLLFENGTIFPRMADDIFCFCCISIAVICVATAIFFLVRALNVAIMAPLANDTWKYELHTSLVNMAVRQNRKKLKFWFDRDQLGQIERLVKAASENAAVVLERKGDRLISFTVMDTRSRRVVFTGVFT